MDATRLEELGGAMFGMFWQSDLARALDKSSRTIRFWAAGTRPISDVDAARVECLARARLHALDRTILKGEP